MVFSSKGILQAVNRMPQWLSMMRLPNAVSMTQTCNKLPFYKYTSQCESSMSARNCCSTTNWHAFCMITDAMQAPFINASLTKSHWSSIDVRTNLLFDAHGGYCLSLQSLKVSSWELGLEVRHDAISILQHPLSLLLQHGDARGAALLVLHNPQVGKCSFPAAITSLIAANPREEESATCSQHATSLL